MSGKPEAGDFTGWLVRSDVPRIGTFACSDPLLNHYYEVSLRTIEGNLQGYLTDCPHREKCQWTGDLHAVAEAASYNFDLSKFFPKAARDLRTTLGIVHPHPQSSLPRDPRAPANVAGGRRLPHQARPDWGAATVLVPHTAWLFYGDTGIVRENWPVMEGWMAFLREHAVKEGIIEEGYGDWCPPGSNSEIDTPVALTSTALYYKSLHAMRDMANALGKSGSAETYAREAERIKAAFIDRFHNRQAGHFGTQTGTAMALQLGLYPEARRARVADGLVRLIMEKADGRYTTGIFGHRPLYTVLNDNGKADVTAHLWQQTGFPSLRFLTEKHGLTTWPEVPYDWPEGERYRRNSFNHPMHSGFAAVFHESLSGIRPDPAQPGFRHFILQPCFLPGLEWARADHRSPFGTISSHWKRDGGRIVWNVTVPDGCSASVRLPQASAVRVNVQPAPAPFVELTAGDHTIELL
ncbi:alpha-L-rhamnosidase C-terminal domain-containing protein [Kiritimatiella glycovorans]|uniref:alpha-L-rhamnosidase n=1 Tax=Kiritimatiella glycovorans TaxID=1307763 RepID=A0A0G3EKY1_9BACT|nr:alpha-L-rhamnosidase C-terminal domain-containing protein [Kiritimatiella glycovorans]AKJ65420.1 Alpha-L-rhamnosidase [Kiritimatiella glycovorans]